MGQKVHPIGFRVGVTQGWQSTWYADKEYGRYVKEDYLIRKHVNAKASSAGISKVVIERAANKAKVFVHAAKPGMIQGRGGRGRESLRNELQQLASTEVFLNIMDVRKIDTDAMWVAENIGAQLVKRVSFRRAMKKAITQSMRSGAKGIKVMCSGRLGGAEMSRTEWYREGRVPLHTLRANVDYGLSEAKTSYGIIGVKVWIFKGEILPGDDAARPRS